MVINKKYDDQNITDRVRTKMTENFTRENDANLAETEIKKEYYNDLDSGDSADDPNTGCDHGYSSNNGENGDVNTPDLANCQQTAESEVRFLRQWILVHLDLIQQQNDDILNKEKAIFLLQQENEMVSLFFYANWAKFDLRDFDS